MIVKTAHFEVRADSVDRCLDLIRIFTREVAENEPGTRLYVSLQDHDHPTRFIHVMAFDDRIAEAAHRETPWVSAFVEGLYPNTVDGVTFRDQIAVSGL